ncbi:hypothetical protein K504DRAFT_532960 [Pleomassaria siparia CBS 279.74]|uniref:Uncharacterized protein n=1 Tax=Pleomassaria siparia CBS 279.74 TaxID=1314801 RepID=A0A6G1KAK2_9PLEO|nr:hypothetical protein K504DRAFT_532960 [Pleomassaria siparia CBS 279.74]
MSQSSTPFNDSAIDPFLPPMGQDDFGHGYVPSDEGPTFSPDGSNIFDLDDFLNDNSQLLSTNGSDVSTPDFSGYNFGGSNDSLFPYPPIPGPAAPHPYSIRLQQNQLPSHDTTFNTQFQRPQIVRSATNTPVSGYLQPPPHYQQYSRTQQPHHRRSLSQSDAERISASLAVYQNQAPTPDFVRHLAPRARPISHMASKSKLGPNGGSSTSPGVRGNSAAPTSMPTSTERIVTSIGTPMQMHVTLTGTNEPRFRHMSYEQQMAESPRILEIGAMAVVGPPRRRKKNTAGDGEEENDNRGTLLMKLDEMESHLKQELGHCEKGLKGCEMIREALVKKKEETKENTVN